VIRPIGPRPVILLLRSRPASAGGGLSVFVRSSDFVLEVG
jgi:hypothetical protein